MEIDITSLDSATKYPSIETYHALNPADGRLLEEVMHFRGPVIGTEKINGANGRIVVLPDGDWFIGSRREMLYARGDRIENPMLGLVPALLGIARAVATLEQGHDSIITYFMEVYGRGIEGWKQYTACNEVHYRLFDIAFAPLSVLDLSVEQIALWRKDAGQEFADEQRLHVSVKHLDLQLAPRLFEIDGSELPETIQGMHDFMKEGLPASQAKLAESGAGRPEGIVLRTPDRSVIAKARFDSYERTLRPPQKGKQ